MKTEFNLINERNKLFKIMLDKVPTKAGRYYRIIKDYEEEFIRLIEEKILTDWKGQNECIDWIDKLTGFSEDGKTK